MKKTIVAFVSLVWLFIVTFGSHAQTTVKLPAKAYPVKVPHKTDAGVDRYWHVTQILCLGPSSGGYKFRIYGKAAQSSSSHTINMMYLLPNNRVQIAGAYIFPAITEGKSFKFDIVSAMHHPRSTVSLSMTRHWHGFWKTKGAKPPKKPKRYLLHPHYQKSRTSWRTPLRIRKSPVRNSSPRRQRKTRTSIT